MHLGVIIELACNQAEDGDKLRLLVELEAIVNVPVDLDWCESYHGNGAFAESHTMDGQGWDSKQRSVYPDESGCE